MRLRRSPTGQLILPEYVLLFFVAIAAFIALSLYVQRGFQARMRDTNTYMVLQAVEGCKQAGQGCLDAAGITANNIPTQYEPYYGKVNSRVDRERENTKTLSAFDNYRKIETSRTAINSVSEQLPPELAN